MTEAQWLASDDPGRMLRFLTGHGQGNVWVETGKAPASDRKLRLFACACARQVWDRLESPTMHALAAACLRSDAAQGAREAVEYGYEDQRPAQAAILRDLFSPFRPVTISPAWLAWDGGAVRNLAESIYRGNDFGPDRLGILADALEEAGAPDGDLLRHLRGYARCPKCLGTTRNDIGHPAGPVPCMFCEGGWVRSDAPHVRGCWAVDLLLGKE